MEPVALLSNPLDQGKLRTCGDHLLLSLFVAPPGHEIAALCDPLSGASQIFPITLPADPVRALFSADGEPYLAVQDGDQIVLTRLFNNLCHSNMLREPLNDMVWTGTNLVGIASNSTTIWDLQLSKIASISVGGRWVKPLSDGRLLLAKRSGTLTIWDGSGDPADDLKVPGQRLTTVKVVGDWIVAQFGERLRIYRNGQNWWDGEWTGPLHAATELPDGRIVLGGNKLGVWHPLTRRYTCVAMSSAIFSLHDHGGLYLGLASGLIITPQKQNVRVGSKAVRTLGHVGTHLVYTTDDELGSANLATSS